ncbi:MAG: protease complex subunit PrcB family protein [Cellvibrionaceae bacterium]|nr:protease complex subunit PrcB family protein [Cellvibrionaceae bacterium]
MTAIRFIPALCSVAIAACSAQPTPVQISLRSVHQSQYCGEETAGLRWLTRDAFTALVRGPGSVQHLDTAPAPTVAENEKLLQVSLGQKSSGGYAIALAGEQAPVNDGEVELPLEIQQPGPGGFQTMQLTSPCLVIALPASGYSRVSAGSLGELQVELGQ